MRRNIFCCLMVLSFLLISTARAEGEKPVIAIGNLRNSAGVDPKIADALDDMFVTALQKTGKFEIVERKQLSDIEKEQGLAEAWKTDQEDKNLARVNKLTGAKYYVLGNITSFVDRTKESIHESFGVATTQHISEVSIDVRISDTTTGKVLLADRVAMGAREMDAGTTTISGPPNLNTGQLAEVVRKAIEALAVKVIDAVFPIQVISKEEGLVFLNRGEGGGLREGMVLTVYQPGKELKDPQTGEVLGATEKRVGQVSVTGVRPKFSQASILTDEGIAAGNICRVE